MNKTEITTGIVRYQFPPHDGKRFGCDTLETFFEMAGDKARKRLEALRSTL